MSDLHPVYDIVIVGSAFLYYIIAVATVLTPIVLIAVAASVILGTVIRGT